jgi:hypothetical protein
LNLEGEEKLQIRGWLISTMSLKINQLQEVETPASHA